MPPRSSGCFTCRRRKIRCDEGRPGCEKCKTHGVECPGYRKERNGIEFEDQTSLIVQKAKSRHGGKISSDVWKVDSFDGRMIAKPKTTKSAITFALHQEIFSPILQENQMYQTFLDIYMPKMGRSQSLKFKYMDDMMEVAADHPALRDGLNTLALVQIGHIHRDERLLNASVESYGKALGGLAKAVAKAASVHDDTILAAASLLMVCEFFDKIKTQGPGWFGHVMGVEQLLLSRGPDSLKSDISLQLYYNSRHGSLARSYLLRTTDPYSTPEWRAAALRASSQDWGMGLFDVTIQVPGLLQRFDELDDDGPMALLDADLLMMDCERIESELRKWLDRYHDSIHSHGLQPFTLVTVNEFSTYASLISDWTMPTAYRFTGFLPAYVHSQYWIAMFHVRTTIKAIRELRQNLDQSSPSDIAGAVTDEELTSYIYDLCRCFPSFVEPDAGTQGHIGIFLPLGLALGHFRARNNLKWLRWAAHVKQHIFSKGLSQPDVAYEHLPKARPLRSFSVTDTPMSIDTPYMCTRNTGFVFDDFSDVDLAINWGEEVPGMAAVTSSDGSRETTLSPPEDQGIVEPWEMTLPLYDGSARSKSLFTAYATDKPR
ncbi:hypothetical protein B0A48_15725 [Cryoendolithus antarcticus]|uniref:Zn(2)-C6 fungal-type domain-containing protein n=1 Tax=Cryoendolithus antarcticus TaxID=1507870 RepID=A0A1V8SH36_9PEZI|nr:hypothetical protein B0A48_15725 [Cryoendolithus antarcticus]